MCGLAGFARKPNADGLSEVLACAADLTLAAEDRGKHATGFAVIGESSSFIKKWTVPMSGLVREGIYGSQVDQMVPEDVSYFIAHTRHATLPNKKDRDAAHPYLMGRTVGAHNGTITNWRELGEGYSGANARKTDSQAAVWLLSHLDPSEALAKLDGWWALTWFRDRALHMTRTEERPLSVAYCAEAETLFWCSMKKDLKEIIKRHGFKTTGLWELTPDTVYSFDVHRFNSVTGVDKLKVKLDRPSAKRATKRDRLMVDNAIQPGLWDDRTGHRVEDRRAGGPKFRKEALKHTWVDDFRERREASKPVPLAKTLQAAMERMADLEETVAHLEAQVDALRSENEYMMDLLVEAGAMGDVFCAACGTPEDTDIDGDMVEDPNGQMVHVRCMFAHRC